MKRISFLWIFLCISIAAPVFGWGEGHRTVGRAVAENLPAPWNEKLQGDILTQFLADNSYPDSVEPIEKERFGEKGYERLTEQGILKRFDFHSAKGRCLAFELLVDAIREKDDSRTFLLLGILAHSIADQTACNHDPLVHLATYGWGQGGLNVCPSLILDAFWLDTQPWSRDIFENDVHALNFTATATTPQDVFFRLHAYGWEGTRGFVVGVDILESSARLADCPTDREAGERLARALSFLACWGVERTVQTFLAAEKFAQNEVPTVFEENTIRGDFSKFVEDFIREKPIQSDPYTIPYLSEPGHAPQIAVLHDPTGRFDETCFAGVDRILSCQIAGTLREKYDAALVDVRDFCAKGLNPEQTPILVVSAGKFRTYYILKKEIFLAKLVEFQRAGGKIVWIGECPPPEIAPEIASVLIQNDEPEGYCRPVYPVPMDALMDSSLELQASDGTESWNFVRKPVGQAGWIWQGTRHFFPNTFDSRLDPVLTLKSPDKSRVVGAVFPKSAPVLAYLPTYACFPYVLTNEKPQLNPVRLTLDSAGRTILFEIMERLSR